MLRRPVLISILVALALGISGVIYARGDYWTNGSWSKQIPVSQLDLPATFKANQERGVTFRLPAAPNEVITRP